MAAIVDWARTRRLSAPAAPGQGVRAALGVAAALVGVSGVVVLCLGPATTGSALAPPPAPAALITISPATEVPLNPTTPIQVSVAHGRLRQVQVTDAHTGRVLPGELDAGATRWHTSTGLSYADQYRVSATATNADGHPVRREATVSTLSPRVLASASLVPGSGQHDVGVGQPIVARFNHPITNKAAAEHAMTVTATPAQPGSWFWMSATEAHYRPAAYWQPGSVVTVATNLFGVDLGGGTFGSTNRAETVHVHDAWIAKADGRSEQMHIYHNGQLVNTMPISLGSADHPSHNGPHVISDKQPSIIMDSCTYGVCEGDDGYYKEKVDLDERISNDGEFVHSAPWSVGQQGSDNVSHGCINLAPANAAWFYNHFGIGDVVEITNSGGPPLPVWDTYGDWELDWNHWQAGRATS